MSYKSNIKYIYLYIYLYFNTTLSKIDVVIKYKISTIKW